jgi:hypothetical protein
MHSCLLNYQLVQEKRERIEKETGEKSEDRKNIYCRTY